MPISPQPPSFFEVSPLMVELEFSIQVLKGVNMTTEQTEDLNIITLKNGSLIWIKI
jgi:hypothetical protein